MRSTITLCLTLGLLIAQLPAYASIRAVLDRNQTTLDNPVRLTIVTDQQQAAENIDTTALEQDFKIIGRSSSSNISMRNGTVRAEVQIFLDLLPRREGELVIPALEIANEQSAPITLKVAEGLSNTQLQQDDKTNGVLIETLWERPDTAYVQSQLNLIIRIYHQGNLLDAKLEEPQATDTLIIRMGEDLQGLSSKDGIEYQTVERRYALFPQKSGTLTIPPVAMQMRVPEPRHQQNLRFGFDPFTRGKQVMLRSETLSIEVAPPAPDFSGRTWLPSDSVTLSRSGLPDAAIDQGDAINMQIDITAMGLTGAQLPEVHIEAIKGQFKLYPDQPSFSNTSDGETIKGRRTQTFVLIPSESGTLEIPAINLAWWDRKNKRQQQANLPAESIEVNAPEPGKRTIGAKHSRYRGYNSRPQPGQRQLITQCSRLRTNGLLEMA